MSEYMTESEGRQIMQIYEKKLQNKSNKKYMSLTVRLQDRHRPTSKKLHTPY